MGRLHNGKPVDEARGMLPPAFALRLRPLPASYSAMPTGSLTLCVDQMHHRDEMLKVETAQEWVDAAIACGSDPYLTPGPYRNGVQTEPGRVYLMTMVGDVNWKSFPESRDDLRDEIEAILRRMGRALD